MKKLLSIALCAAMVLTCFAGCGNKGGSSESANTIKIGVFEPTTGENGGGGKQEVLGIRYANKVAPSVEIGGKKYDIKLVEVDNQSDKTAAVTAAQTLVSEKVVGVCGTYGSGCAIAAGQTFADAKIPAIGCSCTNPQVTLGNDYYFRVCFLDPFQGQVMANFAYNTKSCKTAAVITQNGDDYSTGLGGYFKSAYQELGGKVVAEKTYNTNEQDFNALLTDIKKQNPEVLFIPSSINTASLIIKQARDLGIKTPIMAGDTWQNATIIANAGKENCNDVYYSTFFSATDANVQDFVKGFKEYINSDKQNYTDNGNTDEIASVSALGYDTYMAFIEALKKVDGEVTGEKVQEILKGIEFEGVTGKIAFDKNGDAAKDTAYIETFKDGAMQFVGYQGADGKFTAAK